MKIIYDSTNKISALSADSEDGSYPVENLEDEHPKKLWKAASGVTRATLTLTMLPNASGVALFNTNATSVTVTVSTGLPISWGGSTVWGGDTVWAGVDLSTDLFDLSPSNVGSMWAEYTEKTGPHVIQITLEGDSTLQAGILRAGTDYEFNDPMLGIFETLRDFSIVMELNNGATYIRKRDIVRQFNFRVPILRQQASANDFYTFLLDIIQQRGPLALPWRISSNSDDTEWIVYARPAVMPGGDHSSKEYTFVDVTLLEVL